TTTTTLKKKTIISFNESHRQNSHMSLLKHSEKMNLFDNNKVNYERMNNDEEIKNNRLAN
ncbi:MAG: hypothetical protein ACK5YA_00745, partial [bacterium]